MTSRTRTPRRSASKGAGAYVDLTAESETEQTRPLRDSNKHNKRKRVSHPHKL